LTDGRDALSITLDGRADAVVVTLEGELDITTADGLERRLRSIGDDGSARVVVDLTRLLFIDSVGLNTLVASSRAIAAAGGSLVLAGASAHVGRVFEVVRMHQSIRIEETVEAACDAPSE
jgi:anti-anti-sigma factor